MYLHLIGRIPPRCGESDVIRGCPVGEECCPVGLMTNVCDPKLGWREGEPEPEGGVTMPFNTTDWDCKGMREVTTLHYTQFPSRWMWRMPGTLLSQTYMHYMYGQNCYIFLWPPFLWFLYCHYHGQLMNWTSSYRSIYTKYDIVLLLKNSALLIIWYPLPNDWK